MWVVAKYRRSPDSFEYVKCLEVLYSLDNIPNDSYLKSHSGKIFELKRDGNVLLSYFNTTKVKSGATNIPHRRKETLIYCMDIDYVRQNLGSTHAVVGTNYAKILEDVRAINLERI